MSEVGVACILKYLVKGVATERDLSPFSRNSFEPYVAEHILPEAAASRCRATGDIQLQLLKAHYN